MVLLAAFSLDLICPRWNDAGTYFGPAALPVYVATLARSVRDDECSRSLNVDVDGRCFVG